MEQAFLNMSVFLVVFLFPFSPVVISGPRQANLVLIAYASSEGSGAVSPEPSLLAHTSNESKGTFKQKARSLAPLNGWAWAVKICHDGMLEDTNSLDGAHLTVLKQNDADLMADLWCNGLKAFDKV